MPNRQDLSPSIFKTLVENSLDVITLIDEDGYTIFQSLSVEATLGYSPEELIGKNIFDLVHPDDVELALKSHEQILDQLDIPRVIIKFLHKDQT
jgi:PAS domain S-box-containing protein